MQQIPPLHVTEMIQSESNIQYGWFQQRRSSCQDVTVYSCKLPVGTPAPDLSSRLTREAFSMTGYGQKTAEVWRVFLLLFELPSQANESHLPEATGVKAPEKPLLRPFYCQ